MKGFVAFLLLYLSLCTATASPRSNELDQSLKKAFFAIKSVDTFPYEKRRLIDIYARQIVDHGPLAVPFLVRQISNKTRSNVRSIGLLHQPKKGELALILLMKIYELPAEQWPFPPGFDVTQSSLLTPSGFTGGPLAVNDYFTRKQGPKLLQDIWKAH
jgi:hypothetical protein